MTLILWEPIHAKHVQYVIKVHPAPLKTQEKITKLTCFSGDAFPAVVISVVSSLGVINT